MLGVISELVVLAQLVRSLLVSYFLSSSDSRDIAEGNDLTGSPDATRPGQAGSGGSDVSIKNPTNPRTKEDSR